MADIFTQKDFDWYQRQGITPPERLPHGNFTYESPESDKLQRLKVSSWRMEGNQLIGETPNGKFAQRIDPNYILVKTDKQGNPVFKRVAPG